MKRGEVYLPVLGTFVGYHFPYLGHATACQPMKCECPSLRGVHNFQICQSQEHCLFFGSLPVPGRMIRMVGYALAFAE